MECAVKLVVALTDFVPLLDTAEALAAGGQGSGVPLLVDGALSCRAAPAFRLCPSRVRSRHGRGGQRAPPRGDARAQRVRPGRLQLAPPRLKDPPEPPQNKNKNKGEFALSQLYVKSLHARAALKNATRGAFVRPWVEIES